MSNLQDRLKRFIASMDMSVLSFENECGMAQGIVENMSGKSRQRTLEKIRKHFPQLNMKWLLEGEGGMLNPASEIDIDLKMGAHSQLALRDIPNTVPAKAHILLLQERIKSLKEISKIEIDGLSKQLAEKDARIAELQKMNGDRAQCFSLITYFPLSPSHYPAQHTRGIYELVSA